MLAAASFLVIANIRTSRLKPLTGFLLLALINASMCYTHYIAVMLMFGQIFWIRPWQQFAKWWLLSSLVTIVLFVPQLLVFLERSSDVASDGTWLNDVTPEAIWIDFAKFMNSPVSGVVALVFLVASIIIVVRAKFDRTAIWGMCGYLVPLAIMFLMAPVFNLFLDRYLFVLTIPLYGGLAVLSAQLFSAKKWLWLMPIGLVLVFVASVVPGKSHGREQISMLHEINANRTEQSAVVVTPYWHMYTFAWHIGLRHHPDNFAEYMMENGYWFVGVLTVEDIGQLPNQVILMEGADVDHTDPNRASAQVLSAHYVWKGSSDYPYWKVHYFVRE
jgi:hypothetical protein